MFKIIAVDDEAPIIMQLEERLTGMGYDVVGIASSGEEAVTMSKDLRPDLILMDIVMPGELDGIAAADIIKRELDIPVVFLTAYADDEFIKKAKNAGPFGYIVKPFQEGQIRAAIEVGLHSKEAERRLRDSEAVTRALLNAPTDDLILLIGGDGIVLDLNVAATRRIGRGIDDIRGLNLFDLLHTDAGGFTKSKVDEAIRTGKHIRFEYEHLGFWYDGFVYPVLDSKGSVAKVALFVRDITERKKMEEELLKVQKLESLGVLAGGIAHDFNNILTAIIGNISLAQMYAKPGEKIYKILEQAEKASLRAKELTQRFITFSKGGAPKKKKVSISELVRESVSLALSGLNVRCEFFFSDDLWEVKIDEGQMRQVINALAANADEAMPEGETIRVFGENIAIEAKKAVPGLPLREGKYIKLSFQDQGKGIPDEYMSKIFDPYFSTKKRGTQKGMGLGLSTAYSIINKHNGHISIDSEVGVGTVVHVYLPACEEEIPGNVESEVTALEKKILPGGGHFPLMDAGLLSRKARTHSL